MDTSPIRLIAVDLDGTVLDDRKQLTPRTLEALRAAGRQGVLIVPATGRTHAGLPPELLALGAGGMATVYTPVVVGQNGPVP